MSKSFALETTNFDGMMVDDFLNFFCIPRPGNYTNAHPAQGVGYTPFCLFECYSTTAEFLSGIGEGNYNVKYVNGHEYSEFTRDMA
ncbi:unnamed protein product [Ambrosiozyma monospora]|uniref:Unnamed protein product n=1 Tax=Ambrosiozyma monospora TaxID=43982 RepID=A0A9W6YQP4_AMBMO|nr:unnamed protein product [Ambrosiozyma monospora]